MHRQSTGQSFVRRCIAGAALLVLPIHPDALAVQVPAPPISASSAPAESDIDIINDFGRPAIDRLDAAQRLVHSCDAPTSRDRALSLIQGSLEESAPGAFVLHAIATQSTAPAALFQGTAKRLGSATAPEKPLLLHALASFRTRSAARLILAQASHGSDPATARAALDALSRLSGRDDIPDEAQAWALWLESADRLSESDWRAALANAHADRTDRLARRSEELASSLVASLRRLHLKLTDDERSPFLASLLGDPLHVVRDLGFELVARELAAGTHLAPVVADAAISLLQSPDPSVRAQTARLLSQLAPASAADPVAAALGRETDPAAATALLDAASRWPSPSLGPLVVRWIAADPTARRAAIAASWTLYRSGNLATAERFRVLDALRTAPLESLGSSACHLLTSLGNDGDRDTVGALLVSEDTSLRRSAAAALAGDQAFADAILAAARTDPELFTVATSVVLMHRLDPPGFEVLRALPAPSATQHRDGMLQIAAVLPAPETLVVARASRVPDEREAILELLLSDSRIMSESSDPDGLRAILDGTLELATLRLDTGRPDLALSAIDAASPIADQAHTQPFADLATIAWLVSNRIDAASDLNASPDAWLKALRLAAAKPFARDIAAVLSNRFAPTLTDAQMKDLSELLQLIDRLQPPALPSPLPATSPK